MGDTKIPPVTLQPCTAVTNTNSRSRNNSLCIFVSETTLRINAAERVVTELLLQTGDAADLDGPGMMARGVARCL